MTTTRTGRVSKPNSKYAIEPEEAPKPKRVSNAPKKDKPQPKVLNLDLSNVPPSQDVKFSKDWGSYNNEFWVKHFTTPKDEITKLYQEATDKLGDLLPANFRLIDDVPEAFGIANLELKPEFVKPIKEIPLLSKLEKGEYETAGTKSDKNIASSIKFFRNNLPTFNHFHSNSDDISWVVREDRMLVAELLKFYSTKDKTSIATIKSRFNAITRIFRIAYQTKNYQLYDKYSSCVIFLGQQFEADEFDNELNETELKKFVPFNVVLDKQKELQQAFEGLQNKQSILAYDLNQDLLLVSLYSLIPPLRNEVKTLKFTTTSQLKEDWIVIKPNAVLMDLNENKKRHEEILFNLTEDAPDLAKILLTSYELYPRDFLFTHYNKYPDVSSQASVGTLDDRLTKIFSFTGKSVSVNSLRSSYVSYMNSEAIKNGKQLSVKQKEKIAYRMRTSRKYLDEAYLKIFPTSQQDIKPVVAVAVKAEPIDETTPYQRQIMRTQKYYYDNKEKVLAKQKKYKDNQSLISKSRAKMLYYLNSDSEYYKKLKPATQAKYDFKKDANGRWI